PMLCSRYLRVSTGPRHRFQIAADGLNDWLKEKYGRMILWSLRWRWVLVVTAAGVILSTGVIIRHVGKDFIPPDDSSEFQVTLKTPEGTSLSMTSKILEQMEAELRRLPGVKSLLASVGEGEGAGVNDGLIYVRLADLSERKQSQFAIMAQARRAFAKYKGLRIGVAVISPISGGGFNNADFTYFLTGPDLKGLQTAAATIQDGLRKIPGLVDVDSSLVFAKPELNVRINRERAQDLGVKVEDIANSLRTLVGGEEDITKYKEGDDLYQVRLRVRPEDRNRAEAISGLTVPSTRGLVRLDNVATLVEERGPAQIERINRQRQVSFTANLQGLPIGDAIKKAEAITKSLHLPPEYKSGLLGKAKEFGRMIRGFLIAFGLAFIFMYMVLGAQFESFLHPVTILLSLPLSIPFALLSLLLVGQTLTIFSIMGVFMLFGIVKKNAILQVDYTNTLRARGMDRDQAILEANKTRLRPILMTTLVLVAAMIPVAFGQGPGAANRATMAVVIVGGQSLCLLITLLITPVAYSLFDDAATWAKNGGRF
nr:efflux RND transporter permease subunit [Elusimicrobiota bacterium]